MASSSHALRISPSSTVRNASVIPKSFIATPPTNAFIPFTSSNSSFTKNVNLTTTLSSSYFSSVQRKSSFSCRSQAEPIDTEKVQELTVYEINERDRGSPVYLRLSHKPFNSLGDILYTGDMEKRIGITAGICILIQNKPKMGGDRYEAIYSFYFGDYGHIAVQGPYLTYEDTYLAVTSGSRIFEGVRGQVKLHQIVYPFKISYTFYLRGIKDLPQELLAKPVPPTPSIQPILAAKALESYATIAGFTD
ncbi:hypothetical protein TanjilG_12400 [Lupinus angustifolius]|uniref:allene-oxide cyclase n=1 Tax=Lupinus angustifolius TaxID=3871 RepID=A0A4P1QY58_LUPAN|nr:hypothetical protein TanjilG_12400 [Lupinus angustifolius]